MSASHNLSGDVHRLLYIYKQQKVINFQEGPHIESSGQSDNEVVADIHLYSYNNKVNLYIPISRTYEQAQYALYNTHTHIYQNEI